MGHEADGERGSDSLDTERAGDLARKRGLEAKEQ